MAWVAWSPAPDTTGVTVGNSGMKPKAASESCFVADEGDGFDVPHEILNSGNVVTVELKTTRVVGTVNADGRLQVGELLLSQGTLAQPLVLTIRANVTAVDAGGLLDHQTIVTVFLNGQKLGTLGGSFGVGSGWQTFRMGVNVTDVLFPADPRPGEFGQVGQKPDPRSNEISFQFTGEIPFLMALEIDWLTLEPEKQPGLASRPVLLVPGWRRGPDDMVGDGLPMANNAVWAHGLAARDQFFAAVSLDRFGTVDDNAATFSSAVTDLKQRYGVERINVVGYCKGGINARDYAHRNNDVDQLIMLATPNAGSFAVEAMPLSPSASIFAGVDPKKAVNGMRELTGRGMQKFNRRCPQNLHTAYTSEAILSFSPMAATYFQIAGGGRLIDGVESGLNDEFVSVASVNSLEYATRLSFPTQDTDPEAQACAGFDIYAHLCLLSYTSIVDQLFKCLAILTPPQAQTPVRSGCADQAGAAAASGTADPAQDDVTAVVQSLGLDTALIPADGVDQAHTVLVNAVDAALFLVFVDQAVLQLELVSPTGRRIDPATPLTDPAVVHGPLRDAGPVSVTGYSIQAPEAGSWTLEVTGTGTPSPGTAYALAVLAQLPPGTGVVLTAAVDQEQYVAGDQVTITATVTDNGEPVTAAAVTATVTGPDGDTTTNLVLVDDGTGGDAVAGDGVYTGVAAAASSGVSSILVSAQGSAPAFTRQQQLEFLVAPNATKFSGTVSDHGVDVDRDGCFDQLVIEVELDVAVAAAYRLTGTLTDEAGTAIQQLQVEQQLPAGLQNMSLAFDGALLFDSGHDGPYQLEDLVLEDVATQTGLAVGPAYTTAAYAHTDFQHPPLLLTGNTSDHGAHTLHMERLPFEELVIEVEVDAATPVDVEATANLHGEDGSLIAAGRALSSLASGLAMLEFHFTADSIFQAGQPGPFTLQLLSIWGTTADGTEVSLLSPDAVAVTQPYRLEDFAPSPRFTVGGTVTGLAGHGLELELVTPEGPPGTPPTTPLRAGNGPFTFTFPTLVSGNPYEIRVKTEPTNPTQACTVTNASGTIEDVNVTNVEVICV